ncbi:YbdD/YjiX family protein [Povalibacter sp.]|uniref:YbdD/YjiX family protein n=1 Tax=Povalibacter sp. TaxID=1962978 RepID=UPI002F3EB003
MNTRANDAVRSAWKLFRALTTDDAYENYLAHHRAAHPGMPALDRRAFFVREQSRKWSGITRCC